MTPKRRRVFNLCAAIFVTVNAVYHVWRMIVDGARPVDWISLSVEILVLAAILFFEWPEWFHKQKAQKKAAKLLPFLKRGEDLRACVPYAEINEHLPWMDKARNWHLETQDFLTEHSLRALSAFNHVVHVRDADRAVITPFGQLHGLTGLFGDAYQLLQARLDNLQKIMENPEVYF